MPRSPTASMPEPRILGAMQTARRSTSRLQRNDVMSLAPPSTITEPTPRARSSTSRARSSTWPSASFGRRSTVAPRERALWQRSAGARRVTARMVPFAAPFASTAEASVVLRAQGVGEAQRLRGANPTRTTANACQTPIERLGVAHGYGGTIHLSHNSFPAPKISTVRPTRLYTATYIYHTMLNKSGPETGSTADESYP